MAGERIPFEDLTPRLPAWRERLLHVFAIITLGYAAWYLVWRWTSTLNLDALWISVPLALAETVAALTLCLFAFNAWTLHHRDPASPPEGLSVDVWITTYDEPLDVIRKTAIGANSITYPHRTWLLDDGRRLEVARLARELRIGYITRPDNRHAKAGNLNHALAVTHADFILQLDADHIPQPHILDRLLGYMTDERVAFVQSPQQFYNTDAFNTHRNPETGRFITDQNVFFTVVQPGKDRMNAAFFCGSCAVIRRSAIESLGGFSTDTITEDIETSLKLHAAGWTSVYHDEALAWGLAPRTATGFKLQRGRWGRGGMQLLRKHNPLTMRGLTAAQRLSYFGSVIHPIDGPVRLTFLLAPLIYLLAGVYPVRSFGVEFLMHFVPFVVTSLLLHQLLARGRAGPFWFQEFSATAKAFTHMAAIPTLLTSRRLPFRVTPKGLESVAWRTHLPYAAALILSLVAMAWGSHVFLSDQRVTGDADSLAFGVNVFWAGWNALVLGLVLRSSVRSHQRRPLQRFDELLPFQLQVVGPDGVPGAWITAVTENMHEAGLAFRSLKALPVGTHVRIGLPLANGQITVNGLIVHMRPMPAGHAGLHLHGVAFEELPQHVRDAINLHCVHHAVPGMRSRYIDHVDPLAGMVRFIRDPRRGDRDRVQLPVQASLSKRGAPVRELLAVLEDTSAGGARLVLDVPVEAGTRVEYHVPGGSLRGVGEVVNRQAVATPLGERHIVGIRRVAGMPEGRINIERPRLGLMRKVAMVAGLITAMKRFAVTLAAGTSILAAANGPLQAQLGTGYLAGGEAAEDGQNMQLLGFWLSSGGADWRGIGGVIAYRLAYDDGVGGTADIWTANPFVGVRRQWVGAGAQASIGWAFQNESAARGQRRVSSGLTTGLQADRGGPVATSASALVSYSWGDDGYVWSRGRIAHRVAGEETRPLRLGVEATAQGGGGYDAWEAGPLLEWMLGPVSLVSSGGYRRSGTDGGATASTAYLRLEFVVAR